MHREQWKKEREEARQFQTAMDRRVVYLETLTGLLHKPMAAPVMQDPGHRSSSCQVAKLPGMPTLLSTSPAISGDPAHAKASLAPHAAAGGRRGGHTFAP